MHIPRSILSDVDVENEPPGEKKGVVFEIQEGKNET